MLDPGIGCLADAFVFTEHVYHLGPYPLGRVDATFVGCVVDSPAFSQFVDLGSFFDGCMVFPKYEHGVRVLGKLRQQGEGSAFFVCQDGGTAGCIESDADYLFSSPCRTFG